MAYMTRLGLWGLGLTFGTFGEFIHSVENRGVGAMEMVAMDIKVFSYINILTLLFIFKYIFQILVAWSLSFKTIII